jgi:hypothetical protein
MKKFLTLFNEFASGFMQGLIIMACIKYLWGL